MFLNINEDLLKKFEEQLVPSRPENSSIPARVLGYGEITTVFQILSDGLDNVAFKRMPLFDRVEQVEAYKGLYGRYNDQLTEIGLVLPECGAAHIETDSGRIVLYLYQRRLPPETVGNKVIHQVSDADCLSLVHMVLGELNKVWKFNSKRGDRLKVGIDGQISNWAIEGFDSKDAHVDSGSRLLYFDTSTPMIREEGRELLDAELFLKATPPGMRWVLRKFYLQDILDRYYDMRRVCMDLVANFLKEQRQDLMPGLIELVNKFFSEEAAVENLGPLTPQEVEHYYKGDASTWALYLRTRRLHRFVKTRILRGYYPYILPGNIVR